MAYAQHNAALGCQNNALLLSPCNLTRWHYCRSSLAIVGPNGSGKSALVSLIGGRLRRTTKVKGSLSINGKSLSETWVRTTYLSRHDEPLAGVTVEQALVYTGISCYSSSWPYASILRLVCRKAVSPTLNWQFGISAVSRAGCLLCKLRASWNSDSLPRLFSLTQIGHLDSQLAALQRSDIMWRGCYIYVAKLTLCCLQPCCKCQTREMAS